MAVDMFNGEVLTTICTKCKCCLSNKGHCWTCHTTVSVKDLCDCGVCPSMLDDYVQRMKMKVAGIGRVAK